MLFFLHFIRRYPLTSVIVAAVWYLSFFTPPETPLDDVSFVDKWAHIAMYGGTCGAMWWEWAFRHGHRRFGGRALALGWLAPVLMGGLIELLQAYCTGGRRSGDWMDFAANACGVTLALAIAWAAVRLRRPRR